MSEAAFWTRIRGSLHRPPAAVARKMTDAFTAGTPDFYYCVGGVTYFVELKWYARPKRATTPVHVLVTPEQRRYLNMLKQTGVPAFVLLGLDDEWFLLDPSVPEDVAQHELDLTGYAGASRAQVPWRLAAGRGTAGLGEALVAARPPESSSGRPPGSVLGH